MREDVDIKIEKFLVSKQIFNLLLREALNKQGLIF